MLFRLARHMSQFIILLTLCKSVSAAAPEGMQDNVTGIQNTPLVLLTKDLLSNDIDRDGDMLEIAFIDDSINGRAEYDKSAGTITFTPLENFVGQAQFTYLISDGYIGPNYENIGFAIVSIDYQPASSNTPPAAGADTFATEQDNPINIYFSDLLANDSDIDPDDDLSIVAVSPADNGETSINTDLELLVYTPNPTFTGDDNFSYVLSDGRAQSEGDVNVLVENVAKPNTTPQANDDRVQASAETQINIAFSTLLANDSDTDGDALTIIGIDDAVNGYADLDDNAGGIRFSPDMGFIGEARFSYTISDGQGENDRASATVLVDVVPNSQLPTPATTPQASNDVAETPVNMPLDLNFDILLANDSDPEGDALTIDEVRNNTGGVAELMADTRTIRFSPATDFQGSASFFYSLSDGSSSAVAEVIVEVIPYYSVDVTNGSGDGEYRQGTLVNIIADTPAEGQSFAGWNGDVDTVENTEAADTTLRVSAANVSVGATYSTNESDEQAPTQPKNLRVREVTATSVHLRWGRSSDNTGVVGYRVLVNGVPYGNDNPNNRRTIESLTPATSYSFAVVAVDAAGNESARSSSVSATTSNAPSANNEARFFVFGHSLFNHERENTGYWLGQLAAASGTTAAGNGQFGQLSYHGIPPDPEGIFEYIDNAYNPWEDLPGSSFGDKDYSHTLFMPSNFEQEGTPPSGYLNDTFRVMDFVEAQEPSTEIMLYMHWPEPSMLGLRTSGDLGNELSRSNFRTFNEYTASGKYYDWHVEYQNLIAAQRPDYNVKTIPVGPIIADIVENLSFMSDVRFSDMYEDDAPHGTPTTYFLAAMICYRSMFLNNPSSSYTPPASDIIPQVRDNYPQIVTYIEERLNYYNSMSNGLRVY